MKKRVFIVAFIGLLFACLSVTGCEHKHTLVKYERKEAACGEEGYVEHWACSECGKNFGDADGETELTDDEIVLSSTGHTYEWYLSYPGLEAAGRAVGVCEKCEDDADGHVKSVVLPALNDRRYLIAEDTATCSVFGTAKYTIAIQGETFCFETISALNPDRHYPLRHWMKAACIEEGNSEYWVCADCRRYFADETCRIELKEGDWILPVSGHSYSEWEMTVPTLNEEGSAVRTCTVCDEGTAGHSQSEVLPALIERQYYLVTDDTATCIASGTATYRIIFPGYSISFEAESPISPENHNLQFHAPTEAACSAEGNSAYWECKLCQKYFSNDDCAVELQEEDWEIPATGHEWSWQRVNHEEHYLPICSNCGASSSLREEHTFVDGACECGVKRRQYTDEDDPEGLIVVIDMPEDYSGYEYMHITLPYITVGQDEPIIDMIVIFSLIYEVRTDEQYGTLWSASFSWLGVLYNLRFYCDFENGDTFKLYSVCRSLSWRWDIDGDSFGFFVWQSYYETTFGMEKYTYQGLTFLRLDGSLPLVYFDVGGEVDPSPRPEWQILILEVAGREQGFYFYFTYDEDGWITGVRKEHYHVYYSFGVAVTCPTTTEEGVGVKLCMNCSADTEGHIVYVTLPPLTDERYILLESTAATCEEDGTALYQITLDGFTFEFAVDAPATGHDWSWQSLNATEHYFPICSNCGESSSLSEKHNFVDGVCECGVKRRQYTDEDNPEGLIVVIDMPEDYSSNRFIYVTLPYITVGQDKPIIDMRLGSSLIYEAGTDEQYGTLWSAIFSINEQYNLRFYCDFENGDTFKLYSVCRSLSWRWDIDGDSFRFYVWQSYYETTFGLEKYTYQGLTFLRLALPLVYFDVGGEVDPSPRPEWQILILKVAGREKGFYFYFTYDEDGWITGVRQEHYHVYYYRGGIRNRPTMTEEGLGVKGCRDCSAGTEGRIVYVTLPPLTDERYTIWKNTATCEEDGKAYYQITLDGVLFEFAVDIPATGHDWVNWRFSDREHYATCSVCRMASLHEAHEFVDGECKCGAIRREFRDADNPEGLIVLAHVVSPEYLFLTISLPYITAEDGRNFTNIRIRRSELIEVETDERYGTLWAMSVSWGGVRYELKFYCDFENGDTFKLHSINRSLYWGMDLEDYTLRFYVWQSYYETTFGAEKYSYQRLSLSIDGGSIFDVVGETDSSPRPEWLRFTIEVGGEEKELYFYFSYDEDGRVVGITGEER